MHKQKFDNIIEALRAASNWIEFRDKLADSIINLNESIILYICIDKPLNYCATLTTVFVCECLCFKLFLGLRSGAQKRDAFINRSIMHQQTLSSVNNVTSAYQTEASQFVPSIMVFH